MNVFYVSGFLVILLLLPMSLSYAEPATPGTVLTFYVTDSNLSTDHRAVMTISTAGLVDFAINGVPVSGPGAMVETGIDTGVFQLYFTVPDSVDGKPIKDGDVVVFSVQETVLGVIESGVGKPLWHLVNSLRRIHDLQTLTVKNERKSRQNNRKNEQSTL